MRDLPFVTAASLRAEGFLHGFSTAPLDLGLDRATADHARLARAIGYDPAALRLCRQVHGAAVLDDPSPEAASAAEADALIARTLGATVGVRVADCVPILLADPRTRVVAAVHAGWRGAVAGVLARAIAQMGGGDGLIAAVGPAIGTCCFEVGDEVAAQFAADFVRPMPGARPHVDLRGAVDAQLRASGVQRIERVGGCTVCEVGRWHSFRRDGARSGRMLAVISATHRL